MRPLKEDLADMDDILQDFSERKSITLMGRVRYAILDKNKLQDLQSRFRRFSETFKSMFSLLHTEAHDMQIRNDVISQQKLDAILQDQSKAAVGRQIEAQEREEAYQKIDRVLKILEERPVAQAGSVTVLDQTQVLAQLETELKRLGVSSEKAKAARLKATQELSRQPYPSLTSIPPMSPKVVPQMKKPMQVPTAHECRILCVDGAHGGEQSTDILFYFSITDP